MSDGVLVVVAAYNEAERIKETLAALTRAFPGAVVWVADDGSSDETGEIARAAGARVTSCKRPIGKGGAMTLAVGEALAELGDGEEDGEATVLLCDGDLGASAGELKALVVAASEPGAGLVVAAFARRVGGGVGLAVGFARRAIFRRTGLRLDAPISGQRAMRVEVLRDVLPFAPGFGMEIGMTIDAVRAGHRVQELELELEHRATGRTLGGFLHRGRQLVDFWRVYRQQGQRA